MALTLTVQDNTGSVANANSYLTVAEFKAYQDDRGGDYSAYSDPQISVALIKATDYVDTRFRYAGKKRLGRDQTTEWPRTSVWDRDRFYVNDVPLEIKEATAEYAFRALTTTLAPDPDQSDTGARIQSKTETVGPLSESVTYVAGAGYTLPKYPAADQKLLKSGFVRTGGTLARG